MRFIPLVELERALGSYGNLRTPEGRDQILCALNEGKIALSNNQELIGIIGALNDTTLIFYDWIAQDHDLTALLTEKQVKHIFKGKKQLVEHLLFVPFSEFISPYLSAAALRYRDCPDPHTLLRVFSFLSLLTADDQLLVEQELYKPVRERVMEEMNKAAVVKTEAELLLIVDELCNEETIQITGYLSRTSYHTRIWFVDQILELIKHPACTARLAYRITQRLKILELNPEHTKSITTIEKELKRGTLLASHRSISMFQRFRPTSIVAALLFTLVGFTLYFVANYEDQPKSEEELNTASSFESFSQEERMRIDSLLRTQRNNQEVDEKDQDQYLWTQGGGVSLALRKVLKNEQMEALYRDWLLNAALHEQALTDTCKTDKPRFNKRFSGLQDALSRKAEHSVGIMNESAYAVYVFLFEEKKGGQIFSTVIEKGKTSSLSMNLSDHLLFIAGNTLVPFSAPKTAPAEECPSGQFNHHFCSTDANLSVSLSTIYTLKFPSRGRNKLLISGDAQHQFLVADLYGILETN